MTVYNFLTTIIGLRKTALMRERNNEGFRIDERRLTVEVKDTDGRIRKVKSVKLKDMGHFSAHPVIEITLTSSTKGW